MTFDFSNSTYNWHNSNSNVLLLKTCLMMASKMLESTCDNFDLLNLKGWSDDFMENANYDEVLQEISDKYNLYDFRLSPEPKLIGYITISIISHHLTQRVLKVSSIKKK